VVEAAASVATTVDARTAGTVGSLYCAAVWVGFASAAGYASYVGEKSQW
jgi:hypothetical protein